MPNKHLASKWLLLALVLVTAALAWQASPLRSLIGLSRPSTGSAYITTPVERRDIVETVSAAGTLKPVTEVKVGSQVSGQVKELNVDFNSSVRRGEVIARIDPEMFEAKVAQSQAELEMAQTRIPVQRAEIERYSAERDNAKSMAAAATAQTARAALALDDAKRELGRTRALAEKAVASARSLDQAENARASAQAQLAAARAEEQSKAASCRAAEAALQTAQAQLANDLAQLKQKEAQLRQAQLDLDHTFIRAPVTGTVVDRSVDRGQTVAASLYAPTLFTIAQDLTHMQVEASVVEADIRRFVVDQPVSFTVDAYPGRWFKGKVIQIRKAAKSVHNVVIYTVVIAADNPDQALLPGMTANLKVAVARRHDAIVVPNAALRFRPPEEQETAIENRSLTSGAYAAGYDAESPETGRVFLPDDSGKPTPVRVQLGISDGRVTEILAADLPVGTPVITAATVNSKGGDDTTGFLKFRLQ